MSAISNVLQALLDLSPWQIALAVLVVILTPIFLHQFVFAASGLTQLPSVLLIGPSGSGKTSLVTLLERETPAQTHTSSTPLAVEIELPVGTTAGSDKYRSSADPSTQTHKKFFLIDTPGHGKLRNYARQAITTPQNLKGVIFLVDAASLSAADESLRHSAEYLHDALLLLQKRAVGAKGVRGLEMAVLIAANKMDLFTAVPAPLIKSALENEIAKVRVSKSKALLDSGIGMDVESEDKDDWLGEMASDKFAFEQMEEFGVSVSVIGGNVLGGNGANVERWWQWIADRL